MNGRHEPGALREAWESLCLLLANLLPRLRLADRARVHLLRAAGVRAGRSKIWTGFDVRPIGAARRLTIGDGVFINVGMRCALGADGRVFIGDHCAIGPHVSFETVSHDLRWSSSTGWGGTAADIVVKERCWIGARAVVLGGVTIGPDSVVAAGAVVTRDVPPGVVVGGVPARVIRRIADGAGA